ncbi:hypothetical protein AGR3A_pa70062 [Agrobacterium tomkonis CFBP 6623]|uniref:Uncharacterized protein n=1 Tax=Agrobacterium tomkonis CFBP 6623 TaxID=1183432 RepID=A0A1S7SA40_9HYPH|nr:hypothetical protein AGR3A_pa70062 [Agrobacterium tomkonis CFBP 6623]
MAHGLGMWQRLESANQIVDRTRAGTDPHIYSA